MSTNTRKTVTDFKAGQRVRYIPNHAYGDARHKDCELGDVVGVTASTVFVSFDGSMKHTPQGCNPTNLLPEN